MSDAVTPVSPSDESDLAYLKRLASAGRGEPAPFLLLMAVFGGAYGFVLLAIMAAMAIEGWPVQGQRSWTPGPVGIFLSQWSFITAHLTFLAALIWTGWRTLGPKRVRLNRAASAIWTAAFIGLVTTFVAVRLVARDQLPTDAVYAAQLLAPVLLVLWGCAWWATAIASDRRGLLAVSAGSFVAAIALAGVGNSMLQLPIFCACLLLLAFVPAVVLIRLRGR